VSFGVADSLIVESISAISVHASAGLNRPKNAVDSYPFNISGMTFHAFGTSTGSCILGSILDDAAGIPLLCPLLTLFSWLLSRPPPSLHRLSSSPKCSPAHSLSYSHDLFPPALSSRHHALLPRPTPECLWLLHNGGGLRGSGHSPDEPNTSADALGGRDDARSLRVSLSPSPFHSNRPISCLLPA
jgi:hypothetical protein